MIYNNDNTDNDENDNNSNNNKLCSLHNQVMRMMEYEKMAAAEEIGYKINPAWYSSAPSFVPIAVQSWAK